MINRFYENADERKMAIQKINEIRYGKGFKHYKKRFYMNQFSGDISEDEQKKLYIDYKVLNKVIQILTSHCPILEPKKYDTKPNTRGKTKNAKKNALIELALKEIQWSDLSTQIYDTLEANGDCFFYVYFTDEETNGYKIPKLKMLKSEDMRFIELDDFNKPLKYLYKTKIQKDVIDEKTGNITKGTEKEVTTIFEKGKVIKIQDFKSSEGLPQDDSGVETLSSSVPNKDSYTDIIPIIHVFADKKQDEQFSLIPAEEYVNICLHIDQITSDIRSINRQLGFPRIFLIDCEIEKASGKVGGVYVLKTSKSTGSEDPDFSNNQGKIQDIQLNNSQETNFRELEVAMDNLHDIVGITNPTLMAKLGTSDSSKVFQQVNARMENKISKYVDNIIQAFEVYFKILLLENNLYDEKTDAHMSFVKPKDVIKMSEYDRLLNKQLRLNIGEETLRESLIKEGLTPEEIENHIADLNSEVIANNTDVTVAKDTTTPVTKE